MGFVMLSFSPENRFSVGKASNNRGHFWLLVDEVRFCLIFEYGWNSEDNTSPTGTMTVNIRLDAGQIVRVENDFSTQIFGTQSSGLLRSWFTGSWFLFSLE